ncbi:hypothetical protein MMC30_006084 [Trapelia coarctata]|nr:hypothetical protein [Trapelia coarctata]
MPPERIDVHAHFVPPSWRQKSIDTGHSQPDGMPGIPDWSEEAHLELMSSLNITKSVLSISSPGPYLIYPYDAMARETAKECNDFAADLKQRYPNKFGYWAVLPLPDVEGSLLELTRALDEKNADGIVLETNAHGHYLGDPKFDCIFAELNARHAKVFLHPTAPNMVTSIGCIGCAPLPQYPFPIFEFFFDTARAVINLFLSKTVEKCPNITFIIPHAGGALPPMIQRFCSLPKMIGMGGVDIEDVKRQLKEQFYFDLAGFVFPDQIQGLLPFVTTKMLMYGSDYPYTPSDTVKAVSDGMEQDLPSVFQDQNDQRDIYHDNAARLLGDMPKEK